MRSRCRLASNETSNTVCPCDCFFRGAPSSPWGQHRIYMKRVRLPEESKQERRVSQRHQARALGRSSKVRFDGWRRQPAVSNSTQSVGPGILNAAATSCNGQPCWLFSRLPLSSIFFSGLLEHDPGMRRQDLNVSFFHRDGYSHRGLHHHGQRWWRHLGRRLYRRVHRRTIVLVERRPRSSPRHRVPSLRVDPRETGLRQELRLLIHVRRVGTRRRRALGTRRMRRRCGRRRRHFGEGSHHLHMDQNLAAEIMLNLITRQRYQRSSPVLPGSVTGL